MALVGGYLKCVQCICMVKIFTNTAPRRAAPDATAHRPGAGPRQWSRQQRRAGPRQCRAQPEIQNGNPTLRTRNQFCTTEKPCNHRSLTEEFRQKNNDRQMNGAGQQPSSPHRASPLSSGRLRTQKQVVKGFPGYRTRTRNPVSGISSNTVYCVPTKSCIALDSQSCCSLLGGLVNTALVTQLSAALL